MTKPLWLSAANFTSNTTNMCPTSLFVQGGGGLLQVLWQY